MKLKLPPYLLVFDCESIGLHGECFAVGISILDMSTTAEIDRHLWSCSPELARGYDDDRKWVAEHVPALPVTHNTLRELRDAFWRTWLFWKAKGAGMMADCYCPVEARFLAACVDDDPIVRKWEGPYPMHDLASIILAAGGDPTGSYWNAAIDGVQHNPLNDARQGVRMLRTCLEILKAAK